MQGKGLLLLYTTVHLQSSKEQVHPKTLLDVVASRLSPPVNFYPINKTSFQQGLLHQPPHNVNMDAIADSRACLAPSSSLSVMTWSAWILCSLLMPLPQNGIKFYSFPIPHINEPHEKTHVISHRKAEQLFHEWQHNKCYNDSKKSLLLYTLKFRKLGGSVS